MLTVEKLQQYGANTQEGLARCMNNETFYLCIVDMALKAPGFEALADAIRRDDRKAAFEAAHSLKGMLGNVALTPLFQLTSEVTELLRADREADYPARLEEILRQRNALIALRDSE